MTVSQAARIIGLGRPKSKVTEAAAVLQAARLNRAGGRPRVRKHKTGEYCNCRDCELRRMPGRARLRALALGRGRE